MKKNLIDLINFDVILPQLVYARYDFEVILCQKLFFFGFFYENNPFLSSCLLSFENKKTKNAMVKLFWNS